MKVLGVKNVQETKGENRIAKISDLLDFIEKHELKYMPWPEFHVKPKVSFSIAYQSDEILLKFYVEEKHVRATKYKTNTLVNEDSCVEFFISFDEGINYYNFEFNCIGTALVGYGSSRNNRELLDASLVDNLGKKSILSSKNGKGFHWQLTVAIPTSTFINDHIENLAEISCRANFYKCGDLSPEPHFISWSNIVAEAPDFHLPEFFGRLVFEKI